MDGRYVLICKLCYSSWGVQDRTTVARAFQTRYFSLNTRKSFRWRILHHYIHAPTRFVRTRSRSHETRQTVVESVKCEIAAARYTNPRIHLRPPLPYQNVARLYVFAVAHFGPQALPWRVPSVLRGAFGLLRSIPHRRRRETSQC